MAKPLYKGVKCKVKGCDRKAHANFMCELHYRRDLNGYPLDAPLRQKTHRKVDRTGTKLCNGCKEQVPKTEFHAKTGNKDGLSSMCKPCRLKRKGMVQERTTYPVRKEEAESARLAAKFNGLKFRSQPVPAGSVGALDG